MVDVPIIVDCHSCGVPTHEGEHLSGCSLCDADDVSLCCLCDDAEDRSCRAGLEDAVMEQMDRQWVAIHRARAILRRGVPVDRVDAESAWRQLTAVLDEAGKAGQ